MLDDLQALLNCLKYPHGATWPLPTFLHVGLELLQIPAVLLSILGAPRVSSGERPRVYFGFGMYVIANVCWILWSAYTVNLGMLVMQAYFLKTSIAGRHNNRPGIPAEST